MKKKKKRIRIYLLFLFSCIVLFVIISSHLKELQPYLRFRFNESEEERGKSSPLILEPTKDSTAATDVMASNNDVETMEENTPSPSPANFTEPETMKETMAPEEDKKEQIHLAFVGDILLSEGVLSNYEESGLDGILSKNVQAALKIADLTIANEEFPFSNRGVAAEDKQYTFRINPNKAGILTQMGIDVVTLANNHALDFGQDALMDTFDTLDKANITYMGAGKNLDRAKEIQYKTVHGMDIAFLGASRVIPVAEWNATSQKPGMLTTYDPTLLLAQIAEAESKADYTVVYVHWGLERKEWTEDYQKSLAKQYIDAGADLVVGSHPHCLQGMEYYHGKPIVYSLGNFLFGTTINRTAVLQVTVDELQNSKLSIVPCTGADYVTKDITDQDQIEQFHQYLESISYNITIGADGMIQSK